MLVMVPALLNTSTPSPVAIQVAQLAMHGWLQVTGRKPSLQQCRLLNASICEASISLSGRRKAFQVVLYNPLAWERPTEPIRVPVGPGAEDAGWTVTGGCRCCLPSFGCRMRVQQTPHTARQGACAPRERYAAARKLQVGQTTPALGLMVSAGSAHVGEPLQSDAA